MSRTRPTTILATSVVLAITAGCASIGLKQSLDPQLEQVRALRAQLSEDWEAIGSDLDGVERDLAAFANHRIDTEQVDPAVLRQAVEAIELPGDATTEDVEETKEQVEARLAAYEKSVDELDDDARARVEALRNQGSQLGKSLYEELPATLEGITGRADDVAAELAEIKVTAEQVHAMAEQNPLMSAAEQRQLERDKATLDREIEALAGLAQQIATESASYGERLAAATTTFSVEISSLR